METNQKMLALYGAVMLATMSASGAVPPAGPLRLHPDNPHYFDWRGKPTVLITAGEHYGAVLNLDFDYIAYLDELARCQFNLTRVFSGTYREVPGSFNLTGNTLAPASGRFLGPWARSDTPGVADGGHKFDLTQWDDRYFARLKDFIRQANQRGVVVELVLFCTMYDDKVWEASPMHARNNVNDIGGVSKYEVYSAKDRPLFEVQQAVVRKLVTELNAFDNLYYEVCNEPYERGGLAESWNDGIIATIIEIESVLPNQHLIAQGFPPSTAPVADLNPHVSILNFHAAKPVANVGIPRLASPTPPWFNAPVQLRLLARKPGRHLIDLKFLGALARDGCAATLAGCWLLAQVAWAEGIPLANIHIRDPFILPVEQARSYYLVASSGRTVTVRQSEDLKTWGEPKTVFAIPENFWGGDAIWAPEIHEHRGRYYLFATFMNKKSVAEQWTNWPARIHRGTQVLVADSPLGPFKPFANRSHTPTNEMALDGTLWVEDGSPYMVYCHEWVQVRDGGMKLVRLSEDLSGIVGEPQLLFKGSEAPWAPRGRDRYVTDGPSLYRSKSGKLFMLWSSFSETGYTTGIAVSDSGKVAGSWRQQAEPFFRQDGGHAMIFPRFDGGLMLALHSPNRSPDERCRLIEIEDTGDTLVSRDSSQPKTATGTAPAEAKEPWVLAYFRQRYESRVEIDADGQTRTVPLPNPMKEEQLHLALSTDGRHWEPLNGNRPVWNQWLRDPFVGRGPDGLWHLLATGGRPASRPVQANLGPTCLYATSRDLLKWDNARSLHLMKGVRDDVDQQARNVWAPEWVLDQSTGEIVLLWSSSFEDAGWKRSRLWFSRTRDWETFTPAKVLFAPPYSVIDGTLLQHGGTYYLFHKEEEFGAKTGERRAIRLATADRLEGPYRIYQGPLNQGQIAPVITEGPAVMLDPEKPGWLLLYDYCMSNGYGVSSSPDLTCWSVEKSVSLPPDARHGSVARLTAAEAAALRSSFSENQ